jgi:hypothetical protein
MKKVAVILFNFLLVVIPFSCFLAQAQSGATTGSIVGSIADQQGAAIADVSIRVKEITTSFAREAVSVADGSYLLTQLPPGSYEVTVEFKGFKPRTTRITLELGTTRRIDFTLAVSDLSESVEVRDEKTESSANIEQRRIDNLPVNRRNFLDFSLTAPRVTPDRLNISGTSGTSGLSFNGQTTRGNYVTIDGFTNTDIATGAVRSTFSQEVVREFQIVSDGYAAEFGRALSGIINIVTRSGGNDLRGSLFLFNRNDRISARNAFAPAKPPFSQYQFGATLGGPIKRDRAFFFTSFERLSIGNNAAITISDATASSARRLGFPVRNGNVPFSLGQTALLARSDFQLTANNHIAARYNGGFRYDGSFETFGTTKGGLISDTADGLQRLRDNTIAVNNDYFNSSLNLVNETRFLYGRRRQRVTPVDGQNPLVQIFAPEGLVTFGQHPILPQPREENIYQIVDNVTLVRGRHQLKFGGDFTFNDLISARSSFRTFSGGGSAFTAIDFARQLGIPGAPFFSGIEAFDPAVRTPEQRAFLTQLAADLPARVPGFPANLPLADLSLPAIYSQGFGDGRGDADARLFSLFFQDDFRLSPNLLIKAGLRYDLTRVESLTKNDGNVSPRLAIAYRPLKRLNLRAGYGLFFGSTLTAAAQNVATYQRGFQTIFLPFPFSVVPFSSQSHRFAPSDRLPAGVNFIPQLSQRFTVDPRLRASYTQQTGLGADYELSAATTASANYIFVRGLRLFGPRNINPVIRPVSGNPTAGLLTGRVDPTRGDVFEFESAFDSYYHGLTLSINRRFSNRVSGLASYTYSKAIDNVGENLIIIGTTAYADPLNPRQERGLSYNDVRNRFVASGVWELSYTANRWLRDFQLSTIVTLESGRPYTVRAGVDLNRNRDGTTDRPFGIGRNTGITPGYANVDLRLTRTVSFSETARLQGFLEAFNLFNRTNVSQVVTIFPPDAQGNFNLPPQRDGRFIAPPANYRAAFAPRQLQFGFRFIF